MCPLWKKKPCTNFLANPIHLLRAGDAQQQWRHSNGEGRQNLPPGTRILVGFYSRSKAVPARAKHYAENVAMPQREAQEGAEEAQPCKTLQGGHPGSGDSERKGPEAVVNLRM